LTKEEEARIAKLLVETHDSLVRQIRQLSQQVSEHIEMVTRKMDQHDAWFERWKRRRLEDDQESGMSWREIR
jgi:hypothetical protein